MVGVKQVDGVDVGAARYAERIPATASRALHATAGLAAEVITAWNDTMPQMPLEVAPGDDVVTAFLQRAPVLPNVLRMSGRAVAHFWHQLTLPARYAC